MQMPPGTFFQAQRFWPSWARGECRMVHQVSCPLTSGCTVPQRPGLGCCNCSSSGDPRADSLKPQVGFLGAVPRLLPLASPCATHCTSPWSLRWLETSSLSVGFRSK